MAAWRRVQRVLQAKYSVADYIDRSGDMIRRAAGGSASHLLFVVLAPLALWAGSWMHMPPPAHADTPPPAHAEPASAAHADAPQPALSGDMLFAPDVTSFTLDNGLEVVVIPDKRAPVVTHMIWYKVGAADEPEGMSGVAHFLEHLMFKGTARHPNGEFSAVIARLGGQENAFTSSDYTAYFQRVAKGDLPVMMNFEADRMANLKLNLEDIGAERDVVLEERRSRVENNPRSRLGEELQAALYRAHPYGRPVIGWQHEIEALNLEKVVQFYNRYYTPNNAVLVIAGDVDVDALRDLVGETYGQVKRRADTGERRRSKEPPHRAQRMVSLVDPRVAAESFQRLYDVPSIRTAGEGEAESLGLLAHILGTGTTSRLYRALVIDQKIATGAGAWYSGSDIDSGQFGFYASAVEGVAPATLVSAVDSVLSELSRDGVTDAELTRAKVAMLADAVYAQDSQEVMARIFGRAVVGGLAIEHVQTWPQRISRVTPAQIQAVAKKYLRLKRSATGFLRKPAKSDKSPSAENVGRPVPRSLGDEGPSGNDGAGATN